MGIKHLAVALLLSGLGRAAVDDETTHELMTNGLQINQWFGLNEGAFGGTSHRHGSAKPDGAPGTMTDSPPNKSPTNFKAYCYEQPISHFDKSVNGTFCQRYWVSAPNYKPGGPVFLRDPGEGPGDNSATTEAMHYYMAQKFNGVMIVLEHRYYGYSMPTPDLSTDSLRFLNNKEALQDSADFIAHWQPKAGVIPGLVDTKTISPPHTPWIYYGGSYPGARAAHMRALFPDLVWGAIGSSAVVVAKENYPGYFDAVHTYGDKKCVADASAAMKVIDSVLDVGGSASNELKTMFGSETLTDGEFGELLIGPLWSWQTQHWTKDVSTVEFTSNFCPNISAPATATTIDNGKITLSPTVVNWANYVKKYYAGRCKTTMKSCYGDREASYYASHMDITQTWRSWTWQVCNQWGYHGTAYTDGRPSMISKRNTFERMHGMCKKAFPPGKFAKVAENADVDAVNSIGGFNLSRDRLAYINGEYDPWRPVTVHSNEAPQRASTDERPMYLIPRGVHCYDTKRWSNEPQYMADVLTFTIGFMTKWLDEFKATRP